ncbi:MAG: LysM peptidoglycan-binding domain-containing protein [Clostridiales bacterium]|nr:LysM peptidoglycan-binding domain-containing protein [Clostridiales bacterium]
MIEIIYKEEKKNAEGNESFFKLPNNIRQIGEIKGSQKIYIEDYAYTFLKKISRNTKEGGKAAILYGKYHWSEGSSYLFIRSALEIDEMEVSGEHIVFSDKVWGQVYEEGKKYFPDQEIVGWFVSLPGFNMQINEVLLKTHLNHFAGNDKTLFVMEPGEWEEAFFLYESSQLIRQFGYYIYYEKNDAMQEYMIARSQNKSIEETEKIPDRAVIDFRKAVREKQEGEKEPEKENQPGHRNMVVGACAAAAVLAVGITFFNSYQNMQGTISALVPGVEAEEEVQEASGENVQTVPQENKDRQQIFAENQMPEPEMKEDSSGQNALKQEEETAGEEPIQELPAEKIPVEGESAEGEASEENKPENPDAGENETQASQEKVPETEAAQTANTPMEEYIIQRGDTMTSICKKRYGTAARIEEICRLNGMSPDDIIYAGEKILLPD